MPAPVTQVIAAQGLPQSAVSIVIIDPESGHLVLSQNPDIPRSPASTIKTVTTFAALDLLGPAYIWHTRALVHGALEEGVLDGDLILQGGGDPYMTLERWWSFAHALRARGLKTIRGDIVIDNTAFSLPPEDPGAFDGRPNRSYNVLPDALMKPRSPVNEVTGFVLVVSIAAAPDEIRPIDLASCARARGARHMLAANAASISAELR